MNKLVYLTIGTFLLLLGCEEQNPYSGSVSTSSANQGATGDNTGQTTTPDATTDTGIEVDDSADEVADVEDLDEEAATATEIICGSAGMLAEVPGAFAAACVNGEPTVAFVNALENPYMGAGEPTINLLQNDDVNGVSQMKVITSMRVPVDLAGIKAKAVEVNDIDFEQGNASVVQTVLSSVQGTPPVIEDTTVQFDLDVSVAIITVSDRRILSVQAVELDPVTGIGAAKSFLKANEPDNEENILAEQVTFLVPNEDNSTTVITISYQHIDNRGQAATATQTFTAIATSTLTSAYQIYTQ